MPAALVLIDKGKVLEIVPEHNADIEACLSTRGEVKVNRSAALCTAAVQPR